MNKEITDRISEVLAQLRTNALRMATAELHRLYTSEDYGGFIPEHIVRQAVRLADDSSRRLVTEAVTKVLAISSVPDAFTLLPGAVFTYLNELEREVERGHGVSLVPGTLKIVSDKFDRMRTELSHQLDSHRFQFLEPKNKGGRSGKLDWEGALIHLIRLANTPDGLPLGKGAQAEIERIISAWFIRQTGKSPAESEIRKRASPIMRQIGKVGSGVVS
ncbi:hypothetical protein [Rhizorhabdus histidinilytica]|uniref:hypothetical protein n=1 Tax=Rhizorhabdus histidinilytica TaxID=439228 RepID=UPI00322056CE